MAHSKVNYKIAMADIRSGVASQSIQACTVQVLIYSSYKTDTKQVIDRWIGKRENVKNINLHNHF